MIDLHKLLAKERQRLVELCNIYTNDKNKVDNVIQETYLALLEMNQNLLHKIYDTDGINGLLRYCHIIIRRFCCYKKNKFYYKYNKYYENKTTSNDYKGLHYTKTSTNEKLLDKLEKGLENMYWYDREVVRLYYYEKHTLDSLAKKTGISRNSLFNTIDKVRKELKILLSDK